CRPPNRLVSCRFPPAFFALQFPIHAFTASIRSFCVIAFLCNAFMTASSKVPAATRWWMITASFCPCRYSRPLACSYSSSERRRLQSVFRHCLPLTRLPARLVDASGGRQRVDAACLVWSSSIQPSVGLLVESQRMRRPEPRQDGTRGLQIQPASGAGRVRQEK